jgi:hypothetical protein
MLLAIASVPVPGPLRLTDHLEVADPERRGDVVAGGVGVAASASEQHT